MWALGFFVAAVEDGLRAGSAVSRPARAEAHRRGPAAARVPRCIPTAALLPVSRALLVQCR